MTRKSAALLALIGTTLVTILTVWRFLMNLMNHLQGVVAPVVVLSSLIEAFAWVTVAVFLYVFYRTQAQGQ
jgi:nicotinate-nucleotide pyrophosphorylase